MSVEDIARVKWESATESARSLQQQWYESLPEWTIFKEKDLQYLKMQIGFAIYGLPTDDNLENTYDPENDISQIIHYDKRQQEKIETIYEKIYEHGKSTQSTNSLWYGLVYNVLMPTKNEVLQDELKKSKSQNQENNTEEVEVNVHGTPVFKIKKWLEEKPFSKFRGAILMKKKNQPLYEIWYIDIFARVYKSWEDYKHSNNLPECIMILPMYGVYQPDRNQPMTVDNSQVWLEITESPSCSLRSQLRNAGDIGSTVASVAGLAIGVAAMFTPVGPIVAGIGMACAGTSGAWTFGSSVEKLVDRSKHEESIVPDNKEAFSAWLGVTGSTLGLATAGSTVFITKTVAAGKQVGNLGKVVCNTAMGGNLFVNGVGVGFQGYCMYQKYNEERYVSTMDIASFATHLLFFGNAVINIQFAGDIAKSAQGKVVEEYRSTIRTKRLRKAFNRVKRIAGLNNPNIEEANAEVIQYINRRKQFAPNQQYLSPIPRNSDINYQDGLIGGGNTGLLDPREIAFKLILAGMSADLPTRCIRMANNGVMPELKRMMNEFLQKYLPTSPDVTVIDDDFIETLNDISMDKFGKEILTIILNIMSSLITRSDNLKHHIMDAVRFLFLYAKSHIGKFASASEDEADSSLRRILKRIAVMLDPLMPSLLRALQMYINTKFS